MRVARGMLWPVMLLCLLVGPTPSAAQAEGIVVFRDFNLEAAVREAIGKPTGDIYISEAQALNRLVADSHGIVDLSGLEHFVNLRELDLWRNRITDLSPISDLRSLRYLNLGANANLRDISRLSRLTALTDLYLSGNDIRDVSALASLNNLARISLSDNEVSDINPLSGLASLAQLALDGNRIGDLSPLSSMTGLTHLWLSNNRITDVSPLRRIGSLKSLMLRGNQVSDLSPLTELGSLTFLDVSDNRISDLSPVSRIHGLRQLYLRGNQISELSPLSRLPSLAWLDLQGNRIGDVSPLSGLSSLVWLDLYGNSISDIAPLLENEGLGPGDTVRLNGNPLNDTSVNSDVPQLRWRGVNVIWGPPASPAPPPAPFPTLAPRPSPGGTLDNGRGVNLWALAGLVVGLSVVAGLAYYFVLLRRVALRRLRAKRTEGNQGGPVKQANEAKRTKR